MKISMWSTREERRRVRGTVVTILAVFSVSLVGAGKLDAQKRCKKGIPCGKTCIAANKTCHKTTSTSPAPRAEPRRALSDAAAPTEQAGVPLEKCSPAYPDFCIPPPPPDLDCQDVGRKRFTVLPPDPHRFDADHDGLGCER
jgi:hypothetical protein